MSVREGAVLLTAEQVASLFHVDPKTVRRWGARDRLLTTRTPGGNIRYFAAEVRALLAGQDPGQARKLAEAERGRLAGGRT